MKTSKTAVILINLGTPDSPEVKDVDKYLREFLMDGRVIDIPFLSRFFLVNGIIVPFRAKESAKAYQELWTEEGSPLKVYGYQNVEQLQTVLGEDYVVELAMRYQSPSIPEVFSKLEGQDIKKIIVIPLYPQYASATSGSTVEAVMKVVNAWEILPPIDFVGPFFQNSKFIEALSERGREKLNSAHYDHIIISYHGLPERQIRKSSRQNYCQLNEKCCSVYHARNEYCYRAQCFATSRLLAASLGLNEDQYTVSFQSRLGKDPWIQPYTEDVLKRLAQSGKKRVLCFSPAFVCDCLETTIEIGEEYKEEFMKLGGEQWDLVEGLNDHPKWIECLEDLVLKHTD